VNPPKNADPRTGAERDDDRLLGLLQEAVAAVDRLLEANELQGASPLGYSKTQGRKVAVLRALVEAHEALLRPELDASAPLGHAYRSVETVLELEPGAGRSVLEELAHLGLLKRKLVNRVHTCPECGRCQLNFRETCVSCSSLGIEIERLVTHFHCAYTGLESEFAHDLELVCPRCRLQLYQLGQDFERPHDTYVCRECDRIFEEPILEAQCLGCARVFPSNEAEMVSLYSYGPTPLAVRAVELGRLTGLEVSEILYDSNVQLATRDFLALETEREIHRLHRYGGAFSVASLTFFRGPQEFAIFQEWSAQAVQQLAGVLTSTLRPLDLVARLSDSRFGLLLPETDERGAKAVRERLLQLISEVALTTRSGGALAPILRMSTWSQKDTSVAAVMLELEAESWLIEEVGEEDEP